MGVFQSNIAAGFMSLAQLFSAEAQGTGPYAVSRDCAKEALAQTFQGSVEFVDEENGVGAFRIMEKPETPVDGTLSGMVVMDPSGMVHSLNVNVDVWQDDQNFSASSTLEYQDGTRELITSNSVTPPQGMKSVIGSVTESFTRQLDENLRRCSAPQMLSAAPMVPSPFKLG